MSYKIVSMCYPIKSYNTSIRNSNYDFLSIGPTPFNEECIPAGGDTTFSILESRAYIDQLIRNYGEPPEECSFFILKNDHDFGTYYEAAIMYKAVNEKAMAYALRVESGDEYWDHMAVQQLKEGMHPSCHPTAY